MLLETMVSLIILGCVCGVFYFYAGRCERLFKDCHDRGWNCNQFRDEITGISFANHSNLLKIVTEIKNALNEKSIILDKLNKNYHDLEDIKASINFCEQRREIVHPFEQRFDKEMADLKKDYKHKMEMYEGEFLNFRVDIRRSLDAFKEQLNETNKPKKQKEVK